MFPRRIYGDDVEQYAPVVYRQRPREELAFDDHVVEVVLLLLVLLELLERQAVLEVGPELEDVGVRHDLHGYGLLLRGDEQVVQRLSGSAVALPRLLDEPEVYPVPDQPRDEGPLLVLRIPLEENCLDVELARLVEAIQQLAGQPLQVALPGVVQRVAERPAREKEPRH